MKRIRYLPRCGFTLIEMIAVMGSLSIITGIASVLLFQMFDMQILSEERSAQSRSTNRLVSAFRQDVHQFGKPEIVTESKDKANVLLRWKSDSVTVEYELMESKYPGQRFVRRGVQADTKIPQREYFHLPDRSDLRFALGKDKYEGLVALSLWHKTPGGNIPKIEETNPFERTGSFSSAAQNDAAYFGVWRTVFARFQNENRVEGESR